MRKLLFGFVIIVVIAIAAIAIIPSMVPSSVYKEKIQAQLTKELARDVSIEGDVKLSVFPSIRAKTGRVIISNPEGFGDATFAAMDGLEATIKLLPLLSKRVEIAAFKLKNPVINLEKNKDGTANWVLGAERPAQETPAEGPFKRDGRFSNIDPAIGLFSIENGAISYKDAVKDTSYDLKDVNVEFSLPSLADTVKINGDVTFNGQPASLSISLDSPRKFLDGQAAPISFDLKTDFADISTKGEFLASEDIAFDVNVEGKISDVAALKTYLPKGMPYTELANSVDLKGNYKYDGKVFSAKNALISAKGDHLDATFKGDAVMAETPVIDGSVNIDVRDIPKIAALLKQDIQGLDLAKTLKLTADMNAEGTGFAAKNIIASLTGEGLDATFNGTGAYGKDISAKGSFTAKADSVPAVIKTLKLDLPQAKAVGGLTAKGSIDYAAGAAKLSDLSVSTNGGTVEGRYDGQVTMGEVLAFAGNFDSSITSLSEFASVTGTEVLYASSIGKITAKGAVSGQGDAIKISGLDASLTDGQLNGRFQGSAGMAGGFNIDGKLNADIPSLRALAAAGGTQLPPSTKTGQIYENVSIEGNVKGNPADITFRQASLTVDHLKGTGDFTVDLKGAKPFINGVLDLEGLDLRPYMASYAAQNPTGEIQPWSKEPLNLAMLNAVDGDFKFNTPNIIMDRISMGAANVNAKLRNGKLNADLPQLNLYGGLGSVTASVDASGAVPSVAMDVKMANLSSNKFLAAVAGFTKASGEGATALSIRGSGTSQAALMKSLQGQGDFKILNGEMAGVDLAQLLTGLDTALASRSLPSGIGSEYVTKFKDIAGLFKIENGVANINQFNLDGFGVAAIGSGSLDLGSQNIDFRLQPRLTGEAASNLAAFGIPIRLQGGFGNVKAGLDTDMLGKIAAAKAQAAIKKELTDKVGGSAGDILGSILGGRKTPAAQTPTGPGTGTDTDNGTGTETGAPAPQQPKAQPSTEDAVNDLLGGLFGKKPKAEPAAPPQPQTEEEKRKAEEAKKKKEPSIFDLLKQD